MLDPYIVPPLNPETYPPEDLVRYINHFAETGNLKATNSMIVTFLQAHFGDVEGMNEALGKLQDMTFNSHQVNKD